MSTLPDNLTSILDDPKLLPDTPLSEVCGFIENHPIVTGLSDSLRSRKALGDGRRLRVRVRWRVDGTELRPDVVWRAAQHWINAGLAVIAIDDEDGGTPALIPETV